MLRPLALLLVAVSCAHGSTTHSSQSEPTATTAVMAPLPDSSACHPAEFPGSTAGRRLGELVASMNASNSTAAESFVATTLRAEPRERFGDFILSNAGDELVLSLCRVEVDAAHEVVAVLGGDNGRGGFDYGVVVLSVDDQGMVTSLGITPSTREDLLRPTERLDDTDVRRIVNGVADGLADYVFEDVAAAMATRIRTARDAGEYAGITNGHQLAHRLMDDLFAVSRDEHLDLTYRATVPEPSREPTPEELERLHEMAAQDNYGMPVAEIREGNLGYLNVLGFHPPQLAAEAISTTMSALASADVLVIDLRENGGGSPHGVAYLSSYLFGDEPVHLNDLYDRSRDSTESFYTSEDVPGRRFGPSKPVYVLTSAQTFSAAEEFAYNLQALGRATVVGEVTGGGAHSIDFVPVSDHWLIVLPTARAINPITKSNWERTGVVPDVEVPAEQALQRALELAAEHIE